MRLAVAFEFGVDFSHTLLLDNLILNFIKFITQVGNMGSQKKLYSYNKCHAMQLQLPCLWLTDSNSCFLF